MNGGRERSNGHPRSYEEEEEKEEERWKEEELAGMPVALLTFTPELIAFMAEVRPHATVCVLILLCMRPYMRPHTTKTYVSSYSHISRVLILLHKCPSYYCIYPHYYTLS